MKTAQRVFIATAWIFIILAGLLFLVPTASATAQVAAWISFGIGAVSHFILLGAIVFDVIQPAADIPPTDG
jgi:hypothetical protein